MIIQTLPVGKLILADYNPRKELKPGDPEYEKLSDRFRSSGMWSINNENSIRL